MKKIFFVLLLIFTSYSLAQADILCLKNQIKANKKNIVRSRNLITVNTESCPRGYRQLLTTAEFKGDTGPQGLQGAQGLQGELGLPGATGPQGEVGPQGPEGEQGIQGEIGPQGLQGNQGLDGAIRVYGDGSSGDLLINNDTTFSQGVGQFENLIVNEDVTFTVPHGSIIRLTGSAIISGTIEVQQVTGSAASVVGATAGLADVVSQSKLDAIRGIPGTRARNGTIVSSIVHTTGGSGGGQLIGNIRQNLKPSIHTFGGGGASAAISNGVGTYTAGTAGGTIAIIAQEDILISSTGQIRAEGGIPSLSDCFGGGGGGMIFLYAGGNITSINGALISATGALGANGSAQCAAGGGGGGGYISAIAGGTANLTIGTTSVAGGLGAAAQGAGTVNLLPASSGGGGGGSIGFGGSGGNLNADGSTTASGNGLPGSTLQLSDTDPIAILLGS
jgi:hypothetical protein